MRVVLATVILAGALAALCAADEFKYDETKSFEEWVVDTPKQIKPKKGREVHNFEENLPSEEHVIDPPSMYQAMVDMHNSYRAKHSALELMWDGLLASDTAGYASNCSMTHASFGEMMYATNRTDSPAAALKDAVTSWYNEVGMYKFAEPGFSKSSAHFSQLVWKTSSLMGCAAKVCSKPIAGTNFTQGTLVVCRYLPFGNIKGHFAKNVFPPKAAPDAAVISVGTSLESPDCISSLNKKYQLCMRRDARLMLQQVTSQGNYMLWSSNNERRALTDNTPVTFQFDGNLKVMNGDSTKLWSNAPVAQGAPPRRLALQDNGNLVLYDGNNVTLWQTGTKGYTDLQAAAAALLAKH